MACKLAFQFLEAQMNESIKAFFLLRTSICQWPQNERNLELSRRSIVLAYVYMYVLLI